MNEEKSKLSFPFLNSELTYKYTSNTFSCIIFHLQNNQDNSKKQNIPELEEILIKNLIYLFIFSPNDP